MCLLQFALLQITLLSRLQVFLQHVLTWKTNAIFSTTQLRARPQTGMAGFAFIFPSLLRIAAFVFLARVARFSALEMAYLCFMF